MSKSIITKDGITVRVGQVWRDCDKRCHGRTKTVARVDSLNGRVQWAERPQGWVAVRRMHKSATGWVLVSDVPEIFQ